MLFLWRNLQTCRANKKKTATDAVDVLQVDGASLPRAPHATVLRRPHDKCTILTLAAVAFLPRASVTFDCCAVVEQKARYGFVFFSACVVPNIRPTSIIGSAAIASNPATLALATSSYSEREVCCVL